jgi:membrane protein
MGHRGVMWRESLRLLWTHIRRDGLTTASSSAAFYLILSLVPALAAAATVYELVAEASALSLLTRGLEGVVPRNVADVLEQQVQTAVAPERDRSGSIWQAAVWLGLLLWSANRGTRGLVFALSTIYDRAERRPLLLRVGVTLLLTIGFIAVLLLTVPAVLLLPRLLDALGFGNAGGARDALRWPILFLLVAGASAVLYRFGPDRGDINLRWVLLGGAFAALLWMTFSGLMSWYVQTFGGFVQIYGSFGTIAVFLIWTWLSVLAVLLGAEVDSIAHMHRPTSPGKAEKPGDEAASWNSLGGGTFSRKG